jgi:hypothetical protein
MGWRALLEGRETAQKIELSLAERGNLDPAVGTREHRQQALQQHLGQRIRHLAALAWIFDVLEMLKPLNNLIVCALDLKWGVGHGGPLRESIWTCIDSAFSRLVISRFMQSPWPPPEASSKDFLFMLCSINESRVELLSKCVPFFSCERAWCRWITERSTRCGRTTRPGSC